MREFDLLRREGKHIVIVDHERTMGMGHKMVKNCKYWGVGHLRDSAPSMARMQQDEPYQGSLQDHIQAEPRQESPLGSKAVHEVQHG